jgi:transposase
VLFWLKAMGAASKPISVWKLPGGDAGARVLQRSGQIVAYAGLNPSHYRSGSSIDRPTRISKIGNAKLRSALYMPALSAMRFNPAVAALVARLKSTGRLKPKQIVVVAMRKLLVLCFSVLKIGKQFEPAIVMPA